MQEAESIGIDEAYISQLVDAFYLRVREDDQLGPIFLRAFGNEWDQHLTTMKSFWASVTMNAGTYVGKPVQAHRKHVEYIRKEHFGIWLNLFEQTLIDTSASAEAREYFMVRAEKIAQSLTFAVCGQ